MGRFSVLSVTELALLGVFTFSDMSKVADIKGFAVIGAWGKCVILTKFCCLQ